MGVLRVATDNVAQVQYSGYLLLSSVGADESSENRFPYYTARMPPDQMDDEKRITYFGATHTRGKRNIFGIRAIDRGKHVYVIGKTGMGKSTLLENMAIQDIQNGEGICFIDPHGSTAEKLLDFVPHDRVKDVLYFAPFDVEYPIGFNVMEDVGYDKRHLVVSGLMGAFKRIWVDAWSARMEYILQNTLLALLEYPGSTLLDVNRMLSNKVFRKAVVDNIKDPVVGTFWREEFATYTDRYTQEATPAIQNKVGQFVANPLVRNIVGQPTSSFDIRKIMDERKICIVNLSKGRMGESNAALLGSMLTVKIYLAAMSRADEPAARMAKLPRCYFYVDEFQSMMNEAFADILSESRKYKLALTLANQYIEQMEENVRDAVFGNVGTLMAFRVGPFDAEVLKTVFEPTFTAEDLVMLGVGQIYLTLMIDGVGSAPFSAETIPPIEKPNISYRDDVIRYSREHYARSRKELEDLIVKRQQDFAPQIPQKVEGRPPERRGDDRGPRSGPPRPFNSEQRPPRDRDERGDARREGGERRFDGAPRRDDRPRRDDSPPRRDDRPQLDRPQPVREASRDREWDVPERKNAEPQVSAEPRPRTENKEARPQGGGNSPRDLLKEAIAAVAQDDRPKQSPADILRSRRVQKTPEKSEEARPQETEKKQSEARSSAREEKGAPEHNAREPRDQKSNADTQRSDEVSAEELRRVIYGDESVR